MNAAIFFASSPVTMFCGIGPDEKPPFSIAYRTSSSVSLRWSKFGPSLFSRVLTLAGRALGAGGRERVAARAVLHEQLRALVVRIVVGELDARRAAARQREGGGAQRQRGELSDRGSGA